MPRYQLDLTLRRAEGALGRVIGTAERRGFRPLSVDGETREDGDRWYLRLSVEGERSAEFLTAQLETRPLLRCGQRLAALIDHLERALDHLVHGVARVAHLAGAQLADLGDHGVEAPNTEQPGHQVVGGAAIIGIFEQHLGHGVADLVLRVIQPPQPQLVAGEVLPVRQTGHRLLSADHGEAFLGQPAHHLNRGDWLEPFGPAGVRFGREDGRGKTKKLVFRERAGGVVEPRGVRVNGHKVLLDRESDWSHQR